MKLVSVQVSYFILELGIGLIIGKSTARSIGAHNNTVLAHECSLVILEKRVNAATRYLRSNAPNFVLSKFIRYFLLILL